MLRFLSFFLLIFIFSLNLLSNSICAWAVEPEDNKNENQEIKQINHVFWVNFLKNVSKNDYYLSPTEMMSGEVNMSRPNIRIIGNLVLRSPNSVSKCIVRLPSSQINAVNSETKQIIKINLKGNIGNKALSTEFVNPEFDQSLIAPFEIEGYVDSFSLKDGLAPGDYDYSDNLKLIVEFQD